MIPIRQASGVTLVEVMLAMIILAAAVIPIFGLMSYSSGATRLQKAEGVAANLAKEHMNRFMYVLDKPAFDTLPNNTETAGPFSNPTTVEGNDYEITVTVKKHSYASVTLVYPQTKWHNFQATCPGGAEGNSLAAGDFDTKNRTVHQVTQANGDCLYDIMLRVKWKLPNEATFRPVNELLLVSRRAFL